MVRRIAPGPRFGVERLEERTVPTSSGLCGCALDVQDKLVATSIESVDTDVFVPAGERLALTQTEVHFTADVNNQGTIQALPQASVYYHGLLTGAGDLGSGEHVLLGTFSPGNSPACVIVEGDATLGPSATLLIELGGTIACAEYDRITVEQTLTLAGTLQVVLFNEFQPQLGDRFEILNFQTLVGDFTQVQLPTLSAGLEWEIQVDADSYDLLVVEAIGPTVTGVFVRGSSWSGSFLNFLQTQGLGSSSFGYAMPTGGGQLLPLPWGNINTVSIQFDQDVTVEFDDLAIYGINVPVYTLDPSGFGYDSASFTATWQLDGVVFSNDKILLDLDGDSGGVTSIGGVPLDGGWNNGVDDFPSGNGSAGDFQFRINVLPGDVQQNGSVFVADVILVRDAQFRFPGQVGYSILYDVDGSGSIFVNDVIFVRDRQFTFLPGGEPSPPPSLLLAGPTADDSLPAATTADDSSERPADAEPIGSRRLALIDLLLGDPRLRRGLFLEQIRTAG